MTMRCAIFCNIIDNYGDIGVCWRLARQLADECAMDVTLIVDDLASFAVLAPTIQPDQSIQRLDQITVWHWTDSLLFNEPFDLIIEGFGCRLPDPLMMQMQQQASSGKPPHWINLEYLSAEDWVNDCHGMISTHPTTGLKQTFWFPSVTVNSGGLLREDDLVQTRDDFQQSDTAQADFWHSLGIADAARFTRKVSLFSYENPALPHLLTALADDVSTTLLLVPMSRSIPDISTWSAQPLTAGDRIQQGSLTIKILPFLSHDLYDRLLWSCDLNFVRGEDSCVRAQWAGRPWIWHIYPQDEATHISKLHAWITRVDQATTADAHWHLAMDIWNGAAPSTLAIWSYLLQSQEAWQTYAVQWSNALLQQSSLTERLMHRLNDQ